MFRALTTWMAVLLASGPAPVNLAKAILSAGPAVAGSAPQQLSPDDSSAYDFEAEQQLFDLANQARAQAGLAPLQKDDGLTQSARAHAAAMAAEHKLSHQLSGEPSLPQRLAENCTLHLDQAGENVSIARNAQQSHEGLMGSPPHRQNLLNPAYNVAGFGIVRSGFVIYVAQDFGHSLPTYEAQRADEAVAQAVAHLRQDARMPRLRREDGSPAEAIACSMARADSLDTPGPQSAYLLRYTTMRPESMPADAARLINDRRARAFSVGTCYARTTRYPSGAYWVLVTLD